MHHERCISGARRITLRPQASSGKPRSGKPLLGSRTCYTLSASAIAVVVVAAISAPSFAQSSTGCVSSGVDFSNPPELQSSGGVLKDTIYLSDERQLLPTSMDDKINCSEPVVRNFRLNPPKEPRDRNELLNPMPGPTLRAHVGEIVQLTFINQIDPGRFERGLDIEECTRVSDGNIYPNPFHDKYPNCLHASSTANIHFHGTHTNPNSTGDNVYLQIRPLPRNNQGKLTTTADEATAGFSGYFEECFKRLKDSPLESWPAVWNDLPIAWRNKQELLLNAHQLRYSDQRLWDHNAAAIENNTWPIYYIGGFPYCFALPAYTVPDDEWPPPPGSSSPIMGQAPGTHWYHAHKHGSTAINVANGMTGAFIIEGKYDEALREAYGAYTLNSGSWKTRSEKILVLNQLGTVVNALVGGSTGDLGGVNFSVNGNLRPTVEMQPGEIQLWRIVNTSGRTAAYFMPPKDSSGARSLRTASSTLMPRTNKSETRIMAFTWLRQTEWIFS